jgi:hypothetical protein
MAARQRRKIPPLVFRYRVEALAGEEQLCYLSQRGTDELVERLEHTCVALRLAVEHP